MTTVEQEKVKPSIVIEDEITERVFERMGGKPSNFKSIRICNVFEDAWRITVYLEVKANSLIGYKTELTQFFAHVSPEGVVTFQKD